MNLPNIAIIGGGVAGLSAANALIDLGFSSTLIDANAIGQEKISGEFFSHESIEYLQKWGVPLILINSGIFKTTKSSLKIFFDKPSASVSVSLCEKILAKRASSLGVKILENIAVQEIILPTNNSNYILKLSNHESIVADLVVIASGRTPGIINKPINKTSKRDPKYIGLKAHFNKIYNKENELEFYLLDGGYFGLTAIEDSKSNLTCLFPYDLFKDLNNLNISLDKVFQKFPELYDRINNSKMLFDNWLTAHVFGFGKKSLPDWPNAYFIGDAAATIYPASGNGLSMGITSGVMAADYIYKKYFLKIKNQKKFYNLWSERYSSRLVWATILHNIFTKPILINYGFKIANKFPKIAQFFYNKTRQK